MEGAEQVTIVVRRLRTAAGWPGKGRPPTIAGLRGFLPLLDQEHGFNRCSILDSLERSGGSRCYPILEAPEGSVDCVHQFRRPWLSNRVRPSLPAPLRSRHPTQRHRPLTRTRRDRSRYRGQMSHRRLTTLRRAATPRNLRDRLVPLTTISACRLPQRGQTSRSRQSGTVVSTPYCAAISAGQAQPDAGSPCTKRSTGRGRRQRYRASSVSWVRISSDKESL